MVTASQARDSDVARDVFHHSPENLPRRPNVVELRRGPPKTRKLPQSIQSPEGVDLIPSRDGRIELRLPSAILARLAEGIRIYSRALPTLGSNLPTVLSCDFVARRVLVFGDPAESGRPA